MTIALYYRAKTPIFFGVDVKPHIFIWRQETLAIKLIVIHNQVLIVPNLKSQH